MKSVCFRLAAIDLDDTLLGPDKHVSSANLLAIRKLQDAGVQIILASGRKHENMARFHRVLNVPGYIISGQGALAKHAETGEIVYQRYVNAQTGREVVAEGQARGMTVVGYHDDGIYAEGEREFTDLYARLSGDEVMRVDLRSMSGEAFQKVLWLGPRERIAALEPEARTAYAGRADVVVTEPEFLEFTAAGVNKSSALAALAKHLGVSQQQVLAFGDGNNDVAMLRWAGLGIAMDHAKASAKEAADLIAPAGDPETSFARAVELALAREVEMVRLAG